MRTLKLNLIAIAMVVLGAGSASAYAYTMTSNYNGVDILAPSDTVTVTVKFDTQGALNVNNRLMLAAVGVQFDSTVLAYDMMASTAAEYAIGSAAAGNDLVPASTCPGTTTYSYAVVAPYHCALYGLPPAQVQLDFLSSAIASAAGVSANTAAGGNVIATLVFHVIDPGDGLGEIFFVFADARGSIVQTQTRPTTSSPWSYVSHTPTLAGNFAVITPEPTTAVLIGLGLAGLGIAGRRRE